MFLKDTSLPRSLWVPMITSISPAASRSIVLFCSAAVEKRLRVAILTGKPWKRLVMVAKCCCTRMVVGASSAACLPSITHLKMARSATSVLP